MSGFDPAVGDKHHLLRANLEAGTLTSVAVIPDVKQAPLLTASAVDPMHNVFWTQVMDDSSGQLTNVAVDLASGQLTFVPNTLILQTMDFDPKRGCIVGLGLNVYGPKNFSRTLVALDSTTKARLPLPGLLLTFV